MNDYAAKTAYQSDEEAKSYDLKRFSGWRGRLGDYFDKKTLSEALSSIPQKRSGTLQLLDIPCGTGRITQYLIANGYQVVGADVSMEMMRVAQDKVGKLNSFGGFLQLDASQMNFKDKSFDCVVCVRFMGHIPKDVRIQILKEFQRVSHYILIEYSISSRWVNAQRRINHFLKTRSFLAKKWPWHIFSQEEILVEFQEAKLHLEKKWPKLPLLSDSWYLLAKS